MFAPRVTRAQTKVASAWTPQRATAVTQSLGDQPARPLNSILMRPSIGNERGNRHEHQSIASWNFAKIQVYSPDLADPLSAPLLSRQNALQAKLIVGGADDPMEREADRIADQVVYPPAQAAAVPEKFSVARSGLKATGPANATAFDGRDFTAETPALVNEALARPATRLMAKATRSLNRASVAIFLQFVCMPIPRPRLRLAP